MNDLLTESVIYRKQLVLEMPKLLRIQEQRRNKARGAQAYSEENNHLITLHHLNYAVQQATHFIIQQRFMDLVVFAAESVPDNAVFDETVLLEKHGWAEIEAGFVLTDDGLQIAPSGEKRPSILAWATYDGERYNFTLMDKVKFWQGEPMMSDSIQIVPGMLLNDPKFGDRPVGAWPTVLYSLLHLMAQKLAIKTVQRPQGYVGYAIKKLKINAEEVRIITLRRLYEEQREAQDSGREYHCRWVVRGHWRQQFYPSLGSTRPLFIEAYIKGPEDMPLKPITQPIFVARR
jgi:hypothetical protein